MPSVERMGLQLGTADRGTHTHWLNDYVFEMENLFRLRDVAHVMEYRTLSLQSFIRQLVSMHEILSPIQLFQYLVLRSLDNLVLRRL
jgi:hypothetical protein